MHFSDQSVPLNETVDTAVRKFSKDILSVAKELDGSVDVEIDYEDELRADHKERACSALIQSKFGAIIIFPDFVNQSTKASIINRGLIRAMEAEGFGDEEINNAVIYGNLLDNVEDNLHILGLFLTRDLGLQYQKGNLL